MTDGAQIDTADPVHVTVTVSNTGTDPSPPTTLGYTQNRSLPDRYDDDPHYTGILAVPAVPAQGSITVAFDAHYQDGLAAKEAKQIITHDLSFRVDPDDAIPETNEDDNDCHECAVATWMVPNPPIILIHGYMGGGLIKDGQWVYGEQGILQTMLLHPERIMRDQTTDYEADGRLMQVPDAYPPADGFMRNVDLSLSLGDLGLGLEGHDGPIVQFMPQNLQGMWDPLIDDLCQNRGYQLGNDLLLFNYDWRKELNPLRPLPDGLTPTVARLDSLVNDIVNIRHVPGSDRLTIVSHSMGGLVAQAFIRWKGADSHIFRWITLGTPFQGTLDSFAALFNANAGPFQFLDHPQIGSLGRMISKHAASRIGDMVQEFVATWEMLPTPYHDILAPYVPGKWEGHGVYADLGPQPWSQRRITLPVLAQQQFTCSQVKNDRCEGCWSQGWRNNGFSKQYCDAFQRDYMKMDPQVQLHMDSWLIACPNLPTLRGVAHYEKDPPFWQYPFSSGFYVRDKYAVIFGDGDGVVPAWSATTANIDSSHVHVRYCDAIKHRALVQDEELASFVRAIILDEPLNWYNDEFPDDPAAIDDPLRNNQQTWSLEWRNDAAVWNPGKSGYQELPVFPVSLELLDRNTGQVLVWIMQAPDPESGEVIDLPVILDDRFTGYTFGDQITLASNSQEFLSLRLIVRPSPELFPPAGAPAAVKTGAIPLDADFTVLGQLSIFTNIFPWRFPDPDTGSDDYVEFHGLGYPGAYYGFQAYVDFDMYAGAVQQHELELHVDGDGDGEEDYIVTQVSPASERGPASLSISPNPFNPATNLSWRLPEGTETGALSIYDVSGRCVRRYTLREGHRGKIRWDGNNAAGQHVPSGIYFVSLSDGKGRRLALQKVAVVR